jgi:hypothetical protein
VRACVWKDRDQRVLCGTLFRCCKPRTDGGDEPRRVAVPPALLAAGCFTEQRQQLWPDVIKNTEKE